MHRVWGSVGTTRDLMARRFRCGLSRSASNSQNDGATGTLTSRWRCIGAGLRGGVALRIATRGVGEIVHEHEYEYEYAHGRKREFAHVHVHAHEYAHGRKRKRSRTCTSTRTRGRERSRTRTRTRGRERSNTCTCTSTRTRREGRALAPETGKRRALARTDARETLSIPCGRD
jgi:hypothetical protein